MSTTTKGIRLPETDGCVALKFQADGYRLLWEAEQVSEHYHPYAENVRHVSDVNLEQAGFANDVWVAFYIEDCFDPPVYIVRASSWEEAYEGFIDWQVDQLKIEEPDLKDYDEESLHYSSNGVPVGTEGVRGKEVWLIEARFN